MRSKAARMQPPSGPARRRRAKLFGTKWLAVGESWRASRRRVSPGSICMPAKANCLDNRKLGALIGGRELSSGRDSPGTSPTRPGLRGHMVSGRRHRWRRHAPACASRGNPWAPVLEFHLRRPTSECSKAPVESRTKGKQTRAGRRTNSARRDLHFASRRLGVSAAWRCRPAHPSRCAAPHRAAPVSSGPGRLLAGERQIWRQALRWRRPPVCLPACPIQVAVMDGRPSHLLSGRCLSSGCGRRLQVFRRRRWRRSPEVAGLAPRAARQRAGVAPESGRWRLAGLAETRPCLWLGIRPAARLFADVSVRRQVPEAGTHTWRRVKIKSCALLAEPQKRAFEFNLSCVSRCHAILSPSSPDSARPSATGGSRPCELWPVCVVPPSVGHTQRAADKQSDRTHGGRVPNPPRLWACVSLGDTRVHLFVCLLVCLLACLRASLAHCPT